MIALVLGTVLAISALGFVLYPVFFGVPPRRLSRALKEQPQSAEGDTAVVALREIEFDRATGKLSDADYGDLKARYTAQAVAAMREKGGADASDDAIEAAVRAYRAAHPACPTCGPRDEDDAVYCSNCGRYLHDRCASCGAPVEALDARYCVNCGDRLAA